MPEVTDDMVRAALVRRVDAINARRTRRMYAGKLDENGAETLSGAPDGTTWVRSSPESREQTVAYGSASPAGAPLKVIEDYDGSLYIQQPDWAEAIKKMGDAAKTITVVRGYDELLPKNVDALGFKPGRVGASSSGGTYISIQPFSYNGTLVSLSDVDVSSYYPGAADTYGRVGVYYNPETGAAVAFAGSSNTDLAQLMLTDDRADVPAGMLPLGAVIVSTDSGASPNAITNANRFESWRNFLSPNGYLLTGAAATRTIASGVITVGVESIVVAAAQTGTTDDLDTLDFGDSLPRAGWLIADAGDTITAKHGTDNLSCPGGADLDITDDGAVPFVYDGTTVRIAGGGGGGAAALDDLTDVDAPSPANNDVLQYNSSSGSWENRQPSTGMSITIETTTLLETLEVTGSDAASVTSSVSFSGYDYLIIRYHAKSDRASNAEDNVDMYVNGESATTNYTIQSLSAVSTTVAGATATGQTIGRCTASSANGSDFAEGKIVIQNPNGSTWKKAMGWAFGNVSSLYEYRWTWKSTSAITSLTFKPSSTNKFIVGTIFEIYGVKEQQVGGVGYSTDNVTTPTDAELDSAFGQPADLPVPFVGIVNDNDADSAMYLAVSNGTSWWYTSLTKAT